MKCLTCFNDFKIKRNTRGKYCSYKCYWKSGQKYPQRRKGKTNKCKVCKQMFYVPRYRFKAEFCSNKCRGVSLIGKRLSPKTEFKKGMKSYNKGQKLPNITGERNVMWKGNKVGYHGLHKWIYRQKGKPIKCMVCGKTKNIQWANKSHKYFRDVTDFIEMCARCHKSYDLRKFNLL